ncbi:MAG: hypothetical protein DLM55_04145 [Acidimicrobiales bacterium]|nr:MAG: hypothetical protein DLM55_04145 [Acidimicrobiales bacterium]
MLLLKNTAPVLASSEPMVELAFHCVSFTPKRRCRRVDDQVSACFLDLRRAHYLKRSTDSAEAAPGNRRAVAALITSNETTS